MDIKKRSKILVILISSSVFLLSFCIMYYVVNYVLAQPKEGDDLIDEINKIDEIKEEKPEKHIIELSEMETASITEEKIRSYTKMVFQYYFKVDDKLVETEEQPPYYLLNLNREQLVKAYPDWQLQSFSSQKVVLRKHLDEKNTDGYYTIGEHEGYIAVFYDDGRLREVTQTPIVSLPEEEQYKVMEGISVYGEEALIKILEDYTS